MNSYNGIASYPSGIIGGPSAIERRTVKSLGTVFALLLALALCGSAAVARSAAFHANGAFTDASGCSVSQTPFVCVNLSVFTGSTKDQKITFLSYSLTIVDPGTGTGQQAFGFGLIPSSAFQVQPHTDSLNVDTSTVDGFSNQLCTFDQSTITCDSAPGGVVAGAWTVIRNLQTTKSTGTFTSVTPGTIAKTTGTSELQTALANVNVLGAGLANINADVGIQHNTSITVQH